MEHNGNDGEADISRRRIEILQDWAQEKAPDQIARERGLSVEAVYRLLKEIQKQLIGEQGG